ncbi:hypothetical protein Tsubulata_028267 [Turnera subulata]|uniref:F-box/LRR-repeat protein 15/At3g58940/PEG3-like LRR domain-containing protein n=1 Tax=Turnera subulata TaxID=218843 RepID=A0A9Q0F9G5_9ROSI|nr:hypothetical protein Tsubulata_028267 [Turnera subulata]
MDYEDPAMDYELVRLVGFWLMAARKLEKIVFSPTPTFNYKKIFRSLPTASPRAQKKNLLRFSNNVKQETIANKVSDFALDCGDYGDHYEGQKLILLVWAKLGSLCSSDRSRVKHDTSGGSTSELRGFGSLWASSIDNLDLNSCLYHDCNLGPHWDSDDLKFIDFVHQVLLLHQRSNIQRLHLSLRGLWRDLAIHYAYGYNHTKEVSKREKELADICIHFAVRKEVKILDLDFVACFWTNNHDFHHRRMYKVSDSLFSCDSLQQLSLVYCRVAAPAGQICMKSLRTLYLRQVWSHDNTIENLISVCPLLEKLSLIRCYGLQKLNLASPILKYLKFFHETDPEISVPNIKSLALASVSNLLRRCPCLEMLEIQVHRGLGIHDNHFHEICPGGIRDELGFPPSFAHDRMVRGRIIPKVRGRENGGPFKSFSNHLRNVRIHCEEMDYELGQLVGLVLKTARNLEKIVFSPTPTPEYKKIFKSLPAASPRAVILFAIPKQVSF